MRALDGTGSGRPNDARNFLHKSILGLGGKFLSFAGRTIPLPGANILTIAGEVATGLSGRGRSPQLPSGQGVIGLSPSDIPPGLIPKGPGGIVGTLPGVPGGVSGFAVDSVNGSCPPPGGRGNRRINAAGQQAWPGFHWNQSTYTRLGGPCSTKPAGTVLKGTEQVKNRRKFNTANGPARKRAIERLKAGEGDAKDALKAMGYRTISKRSAREMRLPAPRRRHR